MACSAGSLASNALHGAPITKEAICVVVEELIVGLVEDSSGVSLSDSKANCVGEALTKRTSCDFDSFGVMTFRMTRSDTVDLLQRIISAGGNCTSDSWILTRKAFRSSIETL